MIFALLPALAFGLGAMALDARADFSDCSEFFPSASPPDVSAAPLPTKQRELCFSEFALLHSGETKTALFAVQRLDRQTLSAGAGLERTDRFYEEARVPARERARLAHYRGSGYDRGHVVAARSMSTPEGMAQSFSLANVLPEPPTLNRRIWRKVEMDTRKYIERRRLPGPVYVITGAHFAPDAPLHRLHGENREAGPAVPDAIYQLVVDPAAGKTWAHWVENHDKAHVGRPIGYDELVRRTGIAFLAR